MSTGRLARGASITAMLAALSVGSVVGCSQLTGQRAAPPTATLDSRGSVQPTQKPEAAKSSEAPGKIADKSGGARQQMIIRSKTIDMRVSDARKTVSRIDRLAARYRGYITDSSISSGSDGVQPQTVPDGERPRTTDGDETGPLSGTVTVKVPVTSFDKFVRQVRKLGTVRDESESTEDVTQQHIDLTARLRNLRAEERRLTQFFKAAKNVREMLQVESELSRVRGEIESLQGQADFLEKQAAMGTLTVQLSEPGSVVSPSGQDWGIVAAITQAVRNFVGVINFLIMMTGALLPLLLALLIAFWIVRWLLRRFVFRKAST